MSSPGKPDQAIPSYLPPAWGGPFVWIRNAAGNLALHSIPKMTDEMKALVAAVKGGAR